MADNLKWFKVWTSITDDPDFLEMELQDIARWMLLGAYIRKHGENGKITVSYQILSHLLRSQNIEQDLLKLHNIIIVKNDNGGNFIREGQNDNGKITVSFKNWFKYQIDSTGYDRLKKHRKNKMITVQDKIRLRLRLDEIKIKKKKEKEEKEKASSRTTISNEDFIKALKNNPAYGGIEIDKELAKMDMWLLTPKGRGRKKTHTFILNWLSKSEREFKKETEEERYTRLLKEMKEEKNDNGKNL